MPIRRTFVAATSVLVVALITTVPASASGARAAARSAADSRPPTVTRQDCGGGVSAVRMVPPKGFDAFAATDAQLEAVGIPDRPTAAADLAVWTRYVRSPMSSDSSCADLNRRSVTTVPRRVPGKGLMPLAIPIAHSHNWSGYQVSGATYTTVTGHWTIPTATGPSPTAFAYSTGWVGLGTGNDSSHPLIQAGSDSNGNAGNGRSNSLWWEVYPHNSSQSVYSSTTLAGDSLTVTVTATSSKATFHFVDTTSSINRTYTYSGSLGSPRTAEWIHERQTINHGLPYLAKANYTFSSGKAECSGCGGWLTISGLSPTAYVMYNCKEKSELAQPGTLSSDGEGFTSTWKGYGGGVNDSGC